MIRRGPVVSYRTCSTTAHRIVVLAAAAVSLGLWAACSAAEEGEEAAGEVELSVGWVRVSASDGLAYAVRQDGEQRGYTIVQLSQRYGTRSEYQVQDESDSTLCTTTLDVGAYERVCIECDVDARQFRRVQCSN